MGDPPQDRNHPRPVAWSEPDELTAPLLDRVPLPRRARQAHLAPQLRDDGETPSGTPFSAFATATTAAAPRSGSDAPDGRDTAGAFLDGSRRARRPYPAVPPPAADTERRPPR